MIFKEKIKEKKIKKMELLETLFRLCFLFVYLNQIAEGYRGPGNIASRALENLQDIGQDQKFTDDVCTNFFGMVGLMNDLDQGGKAMRKTMGERFEGDPRLLEDQGSSNLGVNDMLLRHFSPAFEGTRKVYDGMQSQLEQLKKIVRTERYQIDYLPLTEKAFLRMVMNDFSEFQSRSGTEMTGMVDTMNDWNNQIEVRNKAVGGNPTKLIPKLFGTYSAEVLSGSNQMYGDMIPRFIQKTSEHIRYLGDLKKMGLKTYKLCLATMDGKLTKSEIELLKKDYRQPDDISLEEVAEIRRSFTKLGTVLSHLNPGIPMDTQVLFSLIPDFRMLLENYDKNYFSTVMNSVTSFTNEIASRMEDPLGRNRRELAFRQLATQKSGAMKEIVDQGVKLIGFVSMLSEFISTGLERDNFINQSLQEKAATMANYFGRKSPQNPVDIDYFYDQLIDTSRFIYLLEKVDAEIRFREEEGIGGLQTLQFKTETENQISQLSEENQVKLNEFLANRAVDTAKSSERDLADMPADEKAQVVDAMAKTSGTGVDQFDQNYRKQVNQEALQAKIQDLKGKQRVEGRFPEGVPPVDVATEINLERAEQELKNLGPQIQTQNDGTVSDVIFAENIRQNEQGTSNQPTVLDQLMDDSDYEPPNMLEINTTKKKEDDPELDELFGHGVRTSQKYNPLNLYSHMTEAYTGRNMNPRVDMENGRNGPKLIIKNPEPQLPPAKMAQIVNNQPPLAQPVVNENLLLEDANNEKLRKGLTQTPTMNASNETFNRVKENNPGVTDTPENREFVAQKEKEMIQNQVVNQVTKEMFEAQEAWYTKMIPGWSKETAVPIFLKSIGLPESEFGNSLTWRDVAAVGVVLTGGVFFLPGMIHLLAANPLLAKFAYSGAVLAAGDAVSGRGMTGEALGAVGGAVGSGISMAGDVFSAGKWWMETLGAIYGLINESPILLGGAGVLLIAAYLNGFRRNVFGITNLMYKTSQKLLGLLGKGTGKAAQLAVKQVSEVMKKQEPEKPIEESMESKVGKEVNDRLKTFNERFKSIDDTQKQILETYHKGNYFQPPMNPYPFLGGPQKGNGLLKNRKKGLYGGRLADNSSLKNSSSRGLGKETSKRLLSKVKKTLDKKRGTVKKKSKKTKKKKKNEHDDSDDSDPDDSDNDDDDSMSSNVSTEKNSRRAKTLRKRKAKLVRLQKIGKLLGKSTLKKK
jgi:hypothetical protein